MKASELIYRLARAIEQRGDLPVTIAIEGIDGMAHDNIELKSLDVFTYSHGFEVYGEEEES
jgi:hypothetical protein